MKQTKTKLAAIGIAMLATIILPSTGVLAATATANTTINGTISPMITIGATTTVAFTVTPGGAALMSSKSATVTVNTNSVSGYNLHIKDSDSTLGMTSGGNTIAPTAGTLAAPAVMGVNRWGYRIDGGVFGSGPVTDLNSQPASGLWAGITASDALIYTKATLASPDTHVIWFGMNVDATQPTGTYTNIVVFTATTK